ESLHDVAEEVGCSRQIKEIVSVRVVLLVNLGKRRFQLVVSSGIVEISIDVIDAAGKPFPQVVIDGASGELFEVFAELFPRVVVAHGAAAHADHGKLAREQLLAGEIVESGNQLASGQVASEAENHHDARIGRAPDSRFGYCWQSF